MDKRVIFLTGVTGFLGGRVLRALLKDTSNELFCLVRSSAGLEGAIKRIEETNKIDISKLPNVKIVPGDITKPYFGIDECTYKSLKTSITDIIHCAASTKFSAPISELRKQNVEPIDSLMELVIDANNGRYSKINIIHVSTAYCAGKTDGLINENERSKPKLGFKNNYERSKWQAEKRLLKHKDKTKIIIVRPSIIMASDRGECNKDGVAIPLFSIIKKNSRKYPTPVPLSGNIFFDIVSVDYVSECVVSALKKANQLESGTTLHATAGLGNELSGKESIKAFNTKFGIKMFGFNAAIFARILSFISKYTNFIDKKDMVIVDAYIDYFKANPRFENTKMLSLLDSGSGPIESRVLLENTIDYWLVNFNKN